MASGMWALYAREVKRFQKLWLDTVFSPIVTVGLYLVVFGVVAGTQTVDGVNYLLFLYCGLIGMLLIMGSFSNPAFALVISKNMGNIIDLQVAPLKPWQVGMAYALAATTRAIVTLAVALLFTAWFIPFGAIAHPVAVLIVLVLTGLQFGLLGVMFGMWATGFEALTFMTQFIMQPMIFFGGVFYPVANLPGIWSTVSLFNPLHHTVNLIRWSVTGYSDVSPVISLVVTLSLIVVFFIGMHVITEKKLRA